MPNPLHIPHENHLQFGKRQARYEGHTIGECRLVIGWEAILTGRAAEC